MSADGAAAGRRLGRRATIGAGLAAVALAFGCVGCAGTPKAPVGPRVTVEDRPYLRSPLDGYPRGVDPATRATIDSAYRELFAGGVPATAREVAATLLAESPELDAARVLELSLIHI